MQLVVLVLNKTECLEELLEKFVEINVKGATIIESSGMAKALYNDSHVSDLFRVAARAYKPAQGEQDGFLRG